MAAKTKKELIKAMNDFAFKGHEVEITEIEKRPTKDKNIPFDISVSHHYEIWDNKQFVEWLLNYLKNK